MKLQHGITWVWCLSPCWLPLLAILNNGKQLPISRSGYASLKKLL